MKIVVITVAMVEDNFEDAEVLEKALKQLLEKYDIDAEVSLYETHVKHPGFFS